MQILALSSVVIMSDFKTIYITTIVMWLNEFLYRTINEAYIYFCSVTLIAFD